MLQTGVLTPAVGFVVLTAVQLPSRIFLELVYQDPEVTLRLTSTPQMATGGVSVSVIFSSGRSLQIGKIRKRMSEAR